MTTDYQGENPGFILFVIIRIAAALIGLGYMYFIAHTLSYAVEKKTENDNRNSVAVENEACAQLDIDYMARIQIHRSIPETMKVDLINCGLMDKP